MMPTAERENLPRERTFTLEVLLVRRVGLALAVLVLLAVFSLPAEAQRPGIAIGQILLEEQRALAGVEDAARKALLAQNFEVVPRSQADYVANVYQTGLEKRRSFNWWILLFPIWPIMGLTESHVTVTVSAQVTDMAGAIVWQGTGESTASTIWFSDFRYPGTDKPLAEATGRALRGAGALASVVPYLDVALDHSARLGIGIAF